MSRLSAPSVEELVAQWLVRHAAGDVEPPELAGEMVLRTARTIYRFVDGVCVGARAADAHSDDRRRSMCGMQLIGWIRENDATKLSERYTPGSRAVLVALGPSTAGAATLATTSRVMSWARRAGRTRPDTVAQAAPPASVREQRREMPTIPDAHRLDVRERFPTTPDLVHAS